MVWKRYKLRYEYDINTARQIEINMLRGTAQWSRALLGTLWHEFESTVEQQFFLTTFGVRGCWAEARKIRMSSQNLMRQCGHCLHKEGCSVVEALWNALWKQHKYFATNENQYAARRCSMITRLICDLLTWVRVYSGAAIFSYYKSSIYIWAICNK